MSSYYKLCLCINKTAKYFEIVWNAVELPSLHAKHKEKECAKKGFNKRNKRKKNQ